MKKILLLSTTLAAASTMMGAPQAKMYENAAFCGISQDGRYAVSNLMNLMMTIHDLTTDEMIALYFDEEMGYNEYMPGFGTCVANDGSVVGNAVIYHWPDETHYTTEDMAVIFKEGEIIPLPVPNSEYGGTAHAVTPDGKYICGNVGNDAFGFEYRQSTQLPALWTRNEDGTYGEPVILPHPDKDFLGGVPQYVTAIAMSTDGNTIAGQVVNSSGWYYYPIVYNRNANGEWSYTLPNLELFYTNQDIVIPENPGEYPDKEDFATDEEKEAYNQALKDWQDAGGTDWSTYPNLDDFMTDEEKQAYEDAVREYEIKKQAYDQAINEATEGAISLVFNNVILSPDGKTYASTVAGLGGGILGAPNKVNAKYNSLRVSSKETEEEYDTDTPYVFNLEEGTYKTYPTETGLQITCSANGGKFVGFSGNVMIGNMKACIVDMATGIQSLEDYFAVNAPELKTWIEDNMTHEVVVDIDEDNNPIYGDMVISGIPFCTPDMTTITSYAYNVWDGLTYADGAVFTGLPEVSGVKGVFNDDKSALSVFKGGIINVSGNADIEVFCADGTRVFNGKASSSLETGLGNGIYVVRAKFADGKVIVRKAAF